MSNKQRGEVDLVVGDTTYTLRLTINAICELEEQTGKGVIEIASDMQAGSSVRLARLLMWACLRNRHPDVTLEGAGDIISDVGLPSASAALGKAVSAAFPPSKAKRHPSMRIAT